MLQYRCEIWGSFGGQKLREMLCLHSFETPLARKVSLDERGGAEDRLPKIAPKFAPCCFRQLLRRGSVTLQASFRVAVTGLCTPQLGLFVAGAILLKLRIKIAKAYWNSEVNCVVDMSFFKEVLQKNFVFEVRNSNFEGSLAGLLRLLSFNAQGLKEVSQKSCIFEGSLAKKFRSNQVKLKSIEFQIIWISNQLYFEPFESQISNQVNPELWIQFNMKSREFESNWISNQFNVKSNEPQINLISNQFNWKSIESQIKWIPNQLNLKPIELETNWILKSIECQVNWISNQSNLNSTEFQTSWISNQLNFKTIESQIKWIST